MSSLRLYSKLHYIQYQGDKLCKAFLRFKKESGLNETKYNKIIEIILEKYPHLKTSKKLNQSSNKFKKDTKVNFEHYIIK